jgi:mRNA interferase RelE/StbE
MATPKSPAAYVRLTAPAVEDLRRLMKVDPQIVRMALKKMILLERDPNAGKPLSGNLIGWRKLVVGDRDWRIVWRVTTDGSGATVVEIAEVWAVGARADLEVYDEMKQRLAAADPGPTTSALSDVVALLGQTMGVVEPTPEPPAADPIPEWLATRLEVQAGMNEEAIAAMTPEEAMEAWEAFITRER